MSLSELVARIRQSGARAAFVVSSFRGNPGTLQIILSSGDIPYELRIESGLLRREIESENHIRITRLVAVGTMNNTGETVQDLSKTIATLLGVEFRSLSSENEIVCGATSEVIMLFRGIGEKAIWCTFHSKDGQEIGPRIRLAGIRRNTNE